MYVRYNLHESFTPGVYLSSPKGRVGVSDLEFLAAVEKSGAVTATVDLSKSKQASAYFLGDKAL